MVVLYTVNMVHRQAGNIFHWHRTQNSPTTTLVLDKYISTNAKNLYFTDLILLFIKLVDIFVNISKYSITEQY